MAALFGALVETLVFAWLRAAGGSLEWSTPTGFMVGAAAVYGLWRCALRQGGGITFAVTCGLVYFLEAGVLAALLDFTGLPELAAAAGAAIFGWSVIVTALIFLRAGEEPDMEGSQRWLSGLSLRVSGALVAYALGLRVLYILLPELLHEEAYYWAFSRFPDLSYLDHPPLVAWTNWLTTRVAGHTELAVRAGAFLSMLTATGFLHALTRRMFDHRVAWGATLLVSVLPAYFMAGWIMTPDALVIASWSAALYFLYRAVIDGEARAWTGVAIAFGLGMLAKYTMGLFGLAGLAFILWDRESRRWLLSPRPYLAAVVASLIFSPVILWNIRNDWISIWWQMGRRVSGKTDFDLFELLGTVVILLTPVGVASLLALGRERRPRVDRDRRLLWTMTLVPFAVFVLFSITRNIKFNWTAPCWIGALPLLAEPLIRGVTTDARRLARWAQIGWRPMLVSLLLLHGVGLHYLALGLADLPYGLNETGLGWRDMGVRFEAVVDAVEAEVGERPLVVGMDTDRIPAWLAFYRSRALAVARGEISSGEAAATTGGDHLMDGKGSFYRWNFVPENYAGRTMILVGHRAADLDGERVRKRSGRLGPIHEIEAHKNGRLASRYHYRTVFDYRPMPSERTGSR